MPTDTEVIDRRVTDHDFARGIAVEFRYGFAQLDFTENDKALAPAHIVLRFRKRNLLNDHTGIAGTGDLTCRHVDSGPWAPLPPRLDAHAPLGHDDAYCILVTSHR